MNSQLDNIYISPLESNKDPLLNKVFFSKYKTEKKLGEGSFGKVYKATYNNKLFAIKFEKRTSNQSLLESEATIMNYLKSKYIPNIESFGQNNEYNILIMQLMDKSLEDLIDYISNLFKFLLKEMNVECGITNKNLAEIFFKSISKGKDKISLIDLVQGFEYIVLE